MLEWLGAVSWASDEGRDGKEKVEISTEMLRKKKNGRVKQGYLE